MRQNLPVTNTEFQFPDGVTLVSTTDLKSHITYCNPAFISVSGYSREELIGQPHNMIRHPDMPPEAFRDMWATLQSGSPWSAMVKNRRKSGEHYWVLANATPVLENGQPVGYMSVRTKPTREQVEQAEKLYARMRAEAASGNVTLALSRGRLVRTGWRGLLQRWTEPTLGRKMGAITLALALGVLFMERAIVGAAAGWQWVGFGVTLTVALAAAAWMRHMMVAPLGDAIAFANRMAAGDLGARLSTQHRGEFGELVRALNQLNVNLQAVVSDVRHEVEGVQVASSEIAAGNQDLSARTESQASSLEETAASMEELSSTVDHSANAAREAASLSERASQVAREGNEAMHKVVQTMDEIHKSSSRIGEIIQVIDGISFQTNILALNAAVEAARAGEQGRGFAVVAAEVRNLAQRTLTAAKEIKVLIDDSASKVSQGSELVHGTGRTMGQVVTAVEQVNSLISDITSAAREQSMGLSQINQAVGQLDSVTQQNSAMVEQLAAAASSLQTQAVVMQESVRIFKLEPASR
ncbi:MAG: PAS domain-containing methyl-accepting chemotaxis protein [Burkholderiales bacterium]|nr:MAG: PAS domain-containing methyl-accepting chemotaxis protein [Burkholderiales bacterium]